MSLLSELKSRAQIKRDKSQQEKQRRVYLEENYRSGIQPKMVLLFSYLSELCELLNYIDTPVRISYPLKNYAALEDLEQVDYKVKADSQSNMKNVRFTYNCVRDRRVDFEVQNKLYIDRLSEYFDGHRLTYTCKKQLDSKHNVTDALFRVESCVPVEFNFVVDVNEQVIVLNVRNYNGLNTDRFVVIPTEINENFFEELGKYVMRRCSNLFKLEMSDTERENLKNRLRHEEKDKQAQDHYHHAMAKQASSQQIEEIQKKQISINLESLRHRDEPVQDTGKAMTVLPQKSESQAVFVDDLSDFHIKFAYLPTAYRSATNKELDLKSHLHLLSELDNFPIQLVHEASKIMISLNKSMVDAVTRIELVEGVFAEVYPVIEALCNRYNDPMGHAIDDNEHDNILPYCILFAEQVAIAYKHVYTKFYTTDRNEFSEVRDDLIKWGIGILEMLRLEQRLRALRYQKLPSHAWLDCNQLFFSLLYHNDIDELRPLCSNLGSSRLQDTQKGDEDLTGSVHKIYLSIQLFGVLDVNTWPSHLFDFPDAYMASCDQALKIELDSGQKLVPGWMISFLRNDAPPVHRRNDVIPPPAVRIDFSVLFKKLVQEHEDLATMMFISSIDLEKLSQPLASLAEQDRIPVLEMMLLSLKPRERHHTRHNIYKREQLVLNFGFGESYKILSGFAKPKNEDTEKSQKYVEMIQEQSVHLANQSLDYRSTNWQIINFSSGGLLVCGEESKYTYPVQIGQIMAFKPVYEAKRPLIGFVGRIHRAQEKQLEISIIRLANYAEAAIVQDPKVTKPDRGKPVVLVQDFSGCWKVIVQYVGHYHYKTGTPLKMVRSHGERILLRLGAIWMQNRHFTVFDVRSVGL